MDKLFYIRLLYPRMREPSCRTLVKLLNEELIIILQITNVQLYKKQVFLLYNGRSQKIALDITQQFGIMFESTVIEPYGAITQLLRKF